jgi:hypothetical protein
MSCGDDGNEHAFEDAFFLSIFPRRRNRGVVKKALRKVDGDYVNRVVLPDTSKVPTRYAVMNRNLSGNRLDSTECTLPTSHSLETMSEFEIRISRRPDSAPIIWVAPYPSTYLALCKARMHAVAGAVLEVWRGHECVHREVTTQEHRR